MKLRTQLTDRTEEKKLTSEAVLARCELAKKFEGAGDYEAAIAAMGQLWKSQNDAEILENLDERAIAELVLRQGVLTGWMGSTRQIEGSQETAKDLISQSITIFEGLRESNKVAEAEADLACCYWRQGAFDEARALLQDALSRLTEGENYLKAMVHLRRAAIESSASRLNDSLQILRKAFPFLDAADSHALKGKFHNELGLVLKNLAVAEQRADYLDQALIEFAAASFHFEQAGHRTYQGCVENNLAALFLKLEKFSEAHEHLDCARRLLFDVHDNVHLAQVNETRARVWLAQGCLDEAERFARSAVKNLERGGEQSLLAEGLTTYGTVLARVGKHSRARIALERAITLAETSGDLTAAGRARLCLIDELGDGMPVKELATIYQAAADLLEPSQDPATRKQLSSCTRKILDALNTELSHRSQANDSSQEEVATKTWEGFSFRSEVIRYERLLIQRALRDAGGIVSRAAQFLGFKHHQSLISLLNTRHKTLIQARSPVRPRRHSIMSSRRKARQPARPAFMVKESHPESVT
jgi:tetratricopeptide (TPR) repeat protein